MKLKNNSIENEQLANNRGWKEKNEKYLTYLKKFIDATDSKHDHESQIHIMARMLKCDLVLTEIAESEIQKAKENKQV